MLITLPLRRILLIFYSLFFIAGISQAETLYWVGGSGNFNDPAHWALNSGGAGGVKAPGITDDVIFDRKSFRGKTIINIIGGVKVHSLSFPERTYPLTFQGTANETWEVAGSFRLNPDVSFDFPGRLSFKSDGEHEVFFSTVEITSDIYFEGNGTWRIFSFRTTPTAEVHLNSGTFNIGEGGLFLGSLIANQQPVTLRLNQTALCIKDRLILGNNVYLVQTGACLQANINDPTRYQLGSNIHFDANKIIAPPDPTACIFTVTSVTNPSCNGVCDGIVTISLPAVCGAGPPYKAVWSNAACPTTLPPVTTGLTPPSYTQTGICGCSQQYTIAFYDAANALKGFANATVTSPGPIVTDYTATAPSCNGVCDGRFDAIIFGGNPPYTVLWNPSATSHPGNLGIDSLVNICVTGLSQTYTVTVTDASGCTASDNPVITQPAVLAANGSSTNVSCFGLSNGSATSAASGGTLPYTYDWSANGYTGDGTASYTNLPAGTYTLDLSDNNGCTDQYTVTITQPADFTYTTSNNSPLNCADVCNGTAAVTAIAGGTGAYIFSWSPAPGSVTNTANSSSVGGACATNYTLTITDANSCTEDVAFSFASPALLVANATITNALCNGGATGALAGNASGGTPAYVYRWYKTSPPPAAPSFIGTPYSSLTAGTYTLVVVDNKGCDDTTTVVVAEPSTITITLTPTNPTCFGLSNGQISAVVAGGTGPYTYDWSANGFTGDGTATYSALPAGTYTLDVTDANGCTQSANVTLTNPTDISANITVTNPTCNGACDGSAIAAPTGGATGAPYTYLWACNGAVTANISGQCAGACNVTVTDAGGCAKVATATFVAPAAITYTQSQTNLVCNDVCNGVATVSAIAGGTTPYSYSWSGSAAVGAPTNTANSSAANSLCQGTYTLTITDAQGCTAAPNFTLTSPTLLVGTITPTNPLCNTGATGQVLGSAAGGTAPYVYHWYNSAQPVSGAQASSANPYTSLNAGVYTLVLLDANGCNDTVSVTLTKPSAITIALSGTNPLCFGSSNGQITAAVAGGTPGYTYDWSANGFTGDGTATYSALPAGTYTLDITDANGCTKSANATITNPLDITPNLTINNPSCNGACDGSASVAPTGGGGGLSYTYFWACNSGTTNSISAQCAGSCNITITDNLGCTKTTTATFTAPAAVSVSLSATAVACSGSTSTITSTISGGTPPYTYLWTPGGQTTAGIAGATAGTYTLDVTDAHGCTGTAQVTVTIPSAVTVTLTPSNPLCNTSADGSITTVAAGGTPGYTYSWSSGQSTANIATLTAGGYTVTVTDANGCTGTQNTTLTAPPAITATMSNTSVSCSGGNDGTASVVAGGGTPGYTYSWAPVGGTGGTTTSYTALTAGTYTVTITDTHGCTKTGTTTVSQPTALSITVSSIVAACNICNGTAVLGHTGGTGAVTYSVDGGAFSATTNLSALCAGSHTVNAIDANGCTATTTFIIPQLITLSITTSNTVVTCNGDCDGAATANVSGNTGALVYNWQPTAQTTQSASTLCAGTHTVTVTDAGTGCFVVDSITFTNPPVLTVNTSSVDVTCFGDCNGSVTATPAGGIPPYTYTWSNGTLTATSSNVCPATYTVHVVDANGCAFAPDPTATVSAVSSFAGTVVNTTPPSTCLASDGSITVTPAGGTPPYTHLWSNSAITATISGLPSGSYTDIVTDANGCDTTIVVGLSDPSGPTTTHTNTNNLCNGDCNATATVDVTAGTAPFLVTWPGGTPAAAAPPLTANNLCAGVYAVQVDDANSCTTFESVTITEPDTVTPNQTITNVLCNAAATGSITVAPTGGTGPFTYNWSPNGFTGDGTATYSALTAGTYTLDITDANLCTYSFNFTVSEPAALSLATTVTNITCAGPNTGTASVVVAGGSPAYSYSWSNGGLTTSIVNVPVGTYTINVIDGNGCTGQTTAVVGQNPTLSGGFSQTNNLCNTGCTGTASFTPTGGNGSYTYLWNTPGNPTTISVNSLCPGTYQGIVYDGNGCSDTTDFTITAPAVVSATFTNVSPTCNGNTNGTSTAAGTGGTPAYSYLWSAPVVSNVALATNLSAGITYTVTVTDANGCTGTASTTLTQPAVLATNVTATQPSCNGTCDGVLSAAPTGGTAPYTYDWFPQTTSSINALCAGTYNLTVTDANGCTASVSPVLTDPAALTLNTSVSTTTCGLCDGSITVTLGVGQSINWLTNPPGGTNSVQTNLCAGIYDIKLTQGVCIDTFSIPVGNSSGPVVAISTTNASCSGICDGTATLTSVTGVSPFTYAWSAPIAGTTTTASAICAGNHISTVTDNAGCVTFTPFTITEPTPINDNPAIVNATCNGLTDGSITLTPTGDTGPYTYLWTPGGATTSSLTNIGPGNYTCTITGFTGCTQTFNYTVGANAVIAYTLTTVNNPCSGQCVGSATLSGISGGTSPYTYLWTDPSASTGLAANNLCSGTYSVTITDAIGCQRQIDTAIITPNPLLDHASSTPPTCGLCDGQISLAPSGGTPAYSYVWSTGATTASITNLCAGSYTVDITDVNSCTAQFTYNINSVSSPMVTSTITNVLCNGAATGAIATTTSGGTAPYFYSWSPGGQNTANLTSQTAGSYTVTVTDVNGCAAVFTSTITEPAAINPNAIVTQPTCGNNDGQIILSPIGGVPAYTYLWPTLGNQTTATVTNVAAGLPTVDITDANGCTETFTITVSNSTGPTVNTTVTDASCNGTCDGAISSAASGGTPAYTYLWAPGGQTTANISAVCAGTYNLQVTDASNCITSVSATVNQSTAITIIPTASDPSCGLSNGQITLNVSGGTAPYTYSWSTSATTQTITGLAAGVYTVTVTDAIACTGTYTVTLSNAGAPNIALTPTDVNCNAACDGSITSLVAGGTAPYLYSWSNLATTANISSLCPNTYTLTVTDAGGCVATATSTINEPAAITENPTVTSPACGASNGQISLAPSGGTAPYTYNWAGGLGTSATITNLSAGTYTVNITDAHACVSTFTVGVSNSSGPAVTATATDVDCFGDCDGTVTTTVSGGTLPYTYSWNTLPALTTANISNQCAGTYIVTVTDAANCVSVASATINENPAITLGGSVTQPTCGNNNGQIIVSASGGVAPYTYNWAAGLGTSNTLNSLAAGVYTVTISDAAGCDTTISITLSNAGAPNITLNVTDANCNGSTDGAIASAVSGGTLPYTYAWSNFATTANISSLAANSYTLTLTDAIGCVATAIGTVNEPAAILDNHTTIAPNCGACNGQAVVTPSGGTAPYTYSWAAGLGTSNTISNLCAGSYTVSITDAHTCVSTFTIGVSNTGGPTVSTTPTHITCFGTCNGSVSSTVSGGVPPYVYSWNTIPMQNSSTISNQCAGTYVLTVTDNINCSTVVSTTLAENPQLTLGGSVTQPTCGVNNGQIIVAASGGVAAYTYSWISPVSNNDTISNLGAGSYVVTITDAVGCDTTISIALSNAGAPTVTLNPTDVTCHGSCNGSVASAVSGGTPGYTYAWAPGSGSGTNISSLCANTYTLTLTDALGCIAVAQALVDEPDTLLPNLYLTSPGCGLSNGQIVTTPTGGTAPYTFAWSSSASTNDTLSGLSAGFYQLTITDANNCSQVYGITLSNPAGPGITLAHTNINCFNDCNGTITSTISGGTTPYAFSWSNGAISQNLSNLCAGSYSLTVIDSNNCTSLSSVTILENAAISANSVVTQPACGQSNGQIVLSPSGGVAPYTYSWNTGGSSATLSGIPAGSYTVTITDNVSCSSTFTITVSDINAPTVAVSTTPVTCFGSCNGSASSTVSGGVSPYTYSWSGGQTTTAISGQCAGTYVLNVTDAAGCHGVVPAAIDGPDSLEANPTITNPSCGLCNGQIVLNPIGGNGTGYAYQWSGGQTTASLSSQCAGVYVVQITDDSSCVSTYTITLNNPGAPAVTPVVTDINCYHACNGSINTNVTGNAPPFTYVWSPQGQVSSSISNLCAGTYFVNVTDTNGCTAVASAIVHEASPITATPIVTNPTCGLCNGQATLTPSGGSGSGYTYVWGDGQTTASVTGMCAGVYNVNITDGVGCVATYSLAISNAGAPTIVLNPTNINCYGAHTGSITSLVTGGASPYTYNWLPNHQTTTSITGLAAGTYFLQVLDHNGCIATAQTTITQAAPFSINPIITPTACGACNGQIVIQPLGGTGAYTYLWNNGSTNDTIANLCAGSYNVIISNLAGCKDTVDIAMNSTTTSPNIVLTGTDVSCFGLCDGMASVAISGGTPPYNTPVWTYNGTNIGNGNPINTLCEGQYAVTVGDASGCSAVAYVTITQPKLLVLSFSNIINPLCNGICTGAINLAPSGGTIPYTFNWTPPQTPSAQSADSLCAGAYNVNVVDQNGCSVTESTALTEPSAIKITAVITPTPCNNQASGAINITVSGGTPPSPDYIYQWSGNIAATTQDISGLVSGGYSLVVTDANNCKADSLFQISAVDTVLADAGNDTTFCLYGPIILNGTQSTANHGTLSYVWTQLPHDTVGHTGIISITPPADTVWYQVEVTNSNNCKDLDTVRVIAHPAPVADAGPDVEIFLDHTSIIGGTPAGSAGTPPYSYHWTSIDTVALSNTTSPNPITSTLVSIDYILTVTDANGCTDTSKMHVTVMPPIVVPSGFSPNGDGSNDTWWIDYIDKFPNNELTVYNRWGEPLYYKKGYNNATGWNGIYNGKPLPVGTYYYVLLLNDPEFSKPYTGPITIFR